MPRKEILQNTCFFGQYNMSRVKFSISHSSYHTLCIQCMWTTFFYQWGVVVNFPHISRANSNIHTRLTLVKEKVQCKSISFGPNSLKFMKIKQNILSKLLYNLHVSNIWVLIPICIIRTMHNYHFRCWIFTFCSRYCLNKMRTCPKQ